MKEKRKFKDISSELIVLLVCLTHIITIRPLKTKEEFLCKIESAEITKFIDLGPFGYIIVIAIISSITLILHKAYTHYLYVLE